MLYVLYSIVVDCLTALNPDVDSYFSNGSDIFYVTLSIAKLRLSSIHDASLRVNDAFSIQELCFPTKDLL